MGEIMKDGETVDPWTKASLKDIKKWHDEHEEVKRIMEEE
jgi:hypothetical protein